MLRLGISLSIFLHLNWLVAGEIYEGTRPVWGSVPYISFMVYWKFRKVVF